MTPVQYGKQQKGVGVQERIPSFFLKFILLCLCAVAPGCSMVKKIQHLPQLLTLRHYSASQEVLAREVDRQDQLFDEMRGEIQSGTFSYQTAREIRNRFGDPVFIRPAVYQDTDARQWLYRRVKDFNGPRIYIYCDAAGRVMAFEELPGAETGE